MNRPNDPSDLSNMQRGTGPRPQLRGSAPPAQPRRQGVVDMPNLRRGPEAAPASRYPTDGRRLVVGKDITLAGQISKCDYLIVEGMVEGMRYEGQSLEVTDSGSFSGNIEVDNADISGSFEGTMLVKNRLTIRPTGRVQGTIRYSELEVNAGGHIAGEIKVAEAMRAQQGVSSLGVTPADDTNESVFTTSERLTGE
jgi:cytoskeletal protein CcmA (bactofilin family)